jgi:hypothetical protein
MPLVRRLLSTRGGYEQVFDTTFTLVTLNEGIEPIALPEAVVPVVAAPVVPAVPVVPVPVVPAAVPGVVVEPELVMLPAPASIVPVNSTF